MKTKLLLLLFFLNFSIFSQVNLVSNGGFENWTNTTTPTNWTVENNVKQSTLTYFRGFNSVQLSTFNNLPKITTQVPMKAGISYTIKFKYKFSSPDFKKHQFPRVSLRISKDGSLKQYSNTEEIVDTEWTTFEGYFTPDQDLPYDLSISLSGYQNHGFIATIDEVMVYVQGTEEYTYIPDRYFELRLRDRGIDTGDIDGLVLTYWINTLTSLNVETDLSSVFITDLTGIQDFTALTSLDCSRNKLTNLDLSKNTALTNLDCSSNNLTTLDLSAQPGITSLACNNNKITSLDLSKHIGLNYISCSNNSLTYLNLKNGNNTAIYWNGTDPGGFTGNSSLTCIQVDDVIYSNKNWMKKKNGTATYSTTCNTLGLEESVFDKVTVYPNPTKGELHINNVFLDKATVYNSLGQLVKTFTLNSSNTNNTINLSGLPKGVYYVYLINQDSASAKKIIVK